MRKGNPLPLIHGLFLISSKWSVICTIPDWIVHITAFVTPVGKRISSTADWYNCVLYCLVLLNSVLFKPCLFIFYRIWYNCVLYCLVLLNSVLFKPCLFIFYRIKYVVSRDELQLYCIRHMVKDHLESKTGNLLLPHWLLFLISSKGSFICTIPQTELSYNNICYTSCGELAGMRNSSEIPPWGIDMLTHCTMNRCSSTELHLTPGCCENQASFWNKQGWKRMLFNKTIQYTIVYCTVLLNNILF